MGLSARSTPKDYYISRRCLQPALGFGIIASVSRTRDLEARLERAEQQLRLFQRASRLMVRQLMVEDALNEIVILVKDFLECDSCLIYLVEEDQLVLHASSDSSRRPVGSVKLRMSEGLTGWVARERRLLSISREAYNDPRFKYFKDLPQDHFEAFLSVPIISQNKVVGVINVQNRAAGTHSGNDIEMLSTIGEQVGCLLVLSQQKSASAVASSEAAAAAPQRLLREPATVGGSSR